MVRDAASRSVEDVAEAIQDLVGAGSYQDTHRRGLRSGGTFTVTNLGAYGIDGFTPIINLPQVAILGVAAVRRVPVIDDRGAITAANQTVLSVTFDHAFVDGAHAAAFLQQVGAAMAG